MNKTTLTKDSLIAVTPRSRHSTITDDFVDTLNNLCSEEGEGLQESFKENILTHSNILQQGKFTMSQYVDAIKFVSMLLYEMPAYKAYGATFPDRRQTAYNKIKRSNPNMTEAELTTEVNDLMVINAVGYKKTLLVRLLLEQTAVPSHILNNGLHQRVINELANKIFSGELKGLNFVKACDSLLNHTKAPDSHKIELEIGGKASDAINDLRTMMDNFAGMQREALQDNKITLDDLSKLKVVSSEDDDE